LIGAKNQTYVGDLKKNSEKGRIIIKTDRVVESTARVIMSVSCEGLKSKTSHLGMSSNNNPFLLIKRCLSPDDVDPENAVIVFESEPIEDTLTPEWEFDEMKLEDLCNSDIDLPLVFEVWSHESDGDHRIYGRVTGTMRYFIDKVGLSHDIIKKQGNPFGTMTFGKFELIEEPSYMSYMRSGWIVSLCAAIDFTYSNGDLSLPESLHYIDPEDPTIKTQYEQAISEVGKILQAYDADRQFPIYGFGAMPVFMGNEELSHCFNLNGQEDPCVKGVKGILAAYRYEIYSLNLTCHYTYLKC
jgi:hypothetical protein